MGQLSCKDGDKTFKGYAIDAQSVTVVITDHTGRSREETVSFGILSANIQDFDDIENNVRVTKTLREGGKWKPGDRLEIAPYGIQVAKKAKFSERASDFFNCRGRTCQLEESSQLESLEEYLQKNKGGGNVEVERCEYIVTPPTITKIPGCSEKICAGTVKCRLSGGKMVTAAARCQLKDKSGGTCKEATECALDNKVKTSFDSSFDMPPEYEQDYIKSIPAINKRRRNNGSGRSGGSGSTR